MSRIAMVVVVAVVAACGPREPGPSEVEFGETQFWEVSSDGTLTFGDACTDAASFRDEIAPPEFAPNSFVVFKIADDGATAILQDCERIDPSSCQDDELNLVFDIDASAHTYTAEGPPLRQDLDSVEDCDLELTQLWTLVDKGETLTLDLEMTTTLVGDEAACADLDQSASEQGTNGQGFDGCVLNIGVETTFTTSR